MCVHNYADYDNVDERQLRTNDERSANGTDVPINIDAGHNIHDAGVFIKSTHARCPTEPPFVHPWD